MFKGLILFVALLLFVPVSSFADGGAALTILFTGDTRATINPRHG
jgi:hypothetical protein